MDKACTPEATTLDALPTEILRLITAHLHAHERHRLSMTRRSLGFLASGIPFGHAEQVMYKHDVNVQIECLCTEWKDLRRIRPQFSVGVHFLMTAFILACNRRKRGDPDPMVRRGGSSDFLDLSVDP